MTKPTKEEIEDCLKIARYFKDYFEERKTDNHLINLVLIIQFLMKNKPLKKLHKINKYVMIDEKGFFYL